MDFRENVDRIADLLTLKILDTPREERFDRLARLVCKVFEVPIVAIALIDKDRQWFKATVGIEQTETPLSESICVHALDKGYLEIEDALKHKSFCDHPAVTGDYQLRFYAGVAFHGPSGQPIGTLCLNDFVPRKLNATQRSWLKCFAELVEYEINRDVDMDQQKSKIENITLRDLTTGLPNEVLLIQTLENVLEVSAAEGLGLAILHLRIDNLDTILRLHGRAARDSVLRKLAERITLAGQRYLVAARTATAQFVVVIPLDSDQSPSQVCGQLVASLGEPITVEECELRVEVDAGISIYPEDGGDTRDLLDRARIALDDCPSGRGINLFTQESNLRAVRYHEIEQRLLTALLENKLTVNYQPIFTADGSRIVSFEALARWQDSKLGNVSPAEFVPIAEKNNRLSYLLTVWMLRTACNEAMKWQETPQGAHLRIGINVPAREFFNPNFVDTVMHVLQDTKMDASRVILELTEESLIRDIDQAVATMRRLSDLGIKLALDDFGTGYSSLSHLRKLPIDTLKLDKSFIDGLPDQIEAVKLVQGIIRIAQDLHLNVVAEGVEFEEQRSLLEIFGCNMIQGYLLGRPVGAQDAQAKLDSVNAISWDELPLIL